MSNLFELSNQFSFLISKIAESGGELTPEVEDRLRELESDILKKVNSIVFIKERLEHDAEYWRTKSRMYSKIAAMLEKASDRLKTNLKLAMNANGIKDLLDEGSRVKLVDMAPKLVIEDESLIPKLYMKQTVIIEPNLEMTRDSLKLGASVPGCKLEAVQALRIYPNKV